MNERKKHNLFIFPQITFVFLNTINDDPKISVEEGETSCNDGKCKLTILAKALKGFCTYYEFVDVAVKVEGFAEHATVRFHVPCACECTRNATNKSSKECNYHGKYTCGICTCDDEWLVKNVIFQKILYWNEILLVDHLLELFITVFIKIQLHCWVNYGLVITTFTDDPVIKNKHWTFENRPISS